MSGANINSFSFITEGAESIFTVKLYILVYFIFCLFMFAPQTTNKKNPSFLPSISHGQNRSRFCFQTQNHQSAFIDDAAMINVCLKSLNLFSVNKRRNNQLVAGSWSRCPAALKKKRSCPKGGIFRLITNWQPKTESDYWAKENQ